MGWHHHGRRVSWQGRSQGSPEGSVIPSGDDPHNSGPIQWARGGSGANAPPLAARPEMTQMSQIRSFYRALLRCSANIYFSKLRFAVVWLGQIQNLHTGHVYVLGLKSGSECLELVKAKTRLFFLAFDGQIVIFQWCFGTQIFFGSANPFGVSNSTFWDVYLTAQVYANQSKARRLPKIGQN